MNSSLFSNSAPKRLLTSSESRPPPVMTPSRGAVAECPHPLHVNPASEPFEGRQRLPVMSGMPRAYGPGFFLRGPISVEHPPAHSPSSYGLLLIRALVKEPAFRN